MSSESSSQFKKRQDNYFSVDQPHLRASIDNYTLKLSKRLAHQVSLNSSDTILEIGCGSGRFTLPLHQLNPDLKIIGLDFSAKLVKQLNNLKLSNTQAILGDIDRVSTLTNLKFNKVIGFYILHHLPNLEKSLRNLALVSRKGAQFGFIEPNPLNPLYYPQPFISKNMSWNEEKGFLKLTESFIHQNFQNAGLKDIRIVKFGFFPPFIVNNSWGLKLDNTLEKMPLKAFLPFQLISARVN